MLLLSINFRRILLRDLGNADRVPFIEYQRDPRYRRLYDFDDEIERLGQLFDLFVAWQREVPRMNYQLGIFERASGRLLGCGGLRKMDDRVAVLGIELAASEWGRFRLALDSATALIRHGFEVLGLHAIIGNTASGNLRIAKLARCFGAEIVAQREGPNWMEARGWQELDWAITRGNWDQVDSSLREEL